MNVPVKRRFDATYAVRLRTCIKRGEYQLVHAHSFAGAVAARDALRTSDIPLVVTVHSEARWRSPEQRAVSNEVYRSCAAVIAVSRSLAATLPHDAGVAPSMVSYIPNAVCASNPVHTILARPARGDSDSRLVGVVARLEPEKGVDVFLDAMAIIHRRSPGVCALIVGDGSARTALEKRATNAGISKVVDFVGERYDVDALMPQFDVLAVPSRSEGSPLVVLEAMHAGVPVVASRVGGIPDQIRHGRDGLLVASGDSRAMAANIMWLIHNPGVAEVMAVSAHDRVTSHFTHDHMLQQTMDVYKRVIHPCRVSGRD